MCVNIPWSQAGFCLWRKSRNEPQTKPILCSVLLCSLSFPKSRKADLRFLRFKLSLNPASAPSLPAARRGSAPDPWAWASCPQALSWPLQLDEDTPGRKVATRAGQEEANSAQNLSSNTTSSSYKNLCSSKDSWSLKPSWTQNPKDKEILSTGIWAPSFLKLPFPPLISEKKGCRSKTIPGSCAHGHLWESAEESQGAFHKNLGYPHSSLKTENTSAKPLIHIIPTSNYSFPPQRNNQE